jgi:hypothetical protein
MSYTILNFHNVLCISHSREEFDFTLSILCFCLITRKIIFIQGDDDIGSEEFTDWLEEEDEEVTEIDDVNIIMTTDEANQALDPFFIDHIDLYEALCEMEDLNFATLPFPKQVELVQSISISIYRPGELIFSENEVDSAYFGIVTADRKTSKVAEVDFLKNEENAPKFVARLRRGQIFGHKYFLTKEKVNGSSMMWLH